MFFEEYLVALSFKGHEIMGFRGEFNGLKRCPKLNSQMKILCLMHWVASYGTLKGIITPVASVKSDIRH